MYFFKKKKKKEKMKERLLAAELCGLVLHTCVMPG